MTKKSKQFDKDYIKDLQNQLLEDKYELRRIAHDYGAKDFLVLISETMYALGYELEADGSGGGDYIIYAEHLDSLLEE